MQVKPNVKYALAIETIPHSNEVKWALYDDQYHKLEEVTLMAGDIPETEILTYSEVYQATHGMMSNDAPTSFVDSNAVDMTALW